jgi:hypothetical protein
LEVDAKFLGDSLAQVSDHSVVVSDSIAVQTDGSVVDKPNFPVVVVPDAGIWASEVSVILIPDGPSGGPPSDDVGPVDGGSASQKDDKGSTAASPPDGLSGNDGSTKNDADGPPSGSSGNSPNP